MDSPLEALSPRKANTALYLSLDGYEKFGEIMGRVGKRGIRRSQRELFLKTNNPDPNGIYLRKISFKNNWELVGHFGFDLRGIAVALAE